jgi:gentisate 1,2-dioxygenase
MDDDHYTQLAKFNLWDELIEMRDEQRERQKTALQVIRGDKLPQETNPLGLVKWYLHPAIKDTALSTLLFFEQEIPAGSRSGRLQSQGGQVMFIVEGKGHTNIDGVRFPWETGDVINFPLRREGLIVQHFNDDPQRLARFVFAEPNWFECTGVDRGVGFEMLEPAPEYRRG